MLMALALLPANTQRVRAKCTSTTAPFSNLSYWDGTIGSPLTGEMSCVCFTVFIASLAASVTGQQTLEARKPQLRTREKAIKETRSYK
ncbi:hypothetical protein JB92DRAFT_2902647 [Gautieria morchelliformis]|nr:hypothetical protein JB92DRAFT_2902647 [Gautieria morchelliformis]